MSIKKMYKPKKANVEKLDKYIEKLRKNGELHDDCTDRERNTDRE